MSKPKAPKRSALALKLEEINKKKIEDYRKNVLPQKLAGVRRIMQNERLNEQRERGIQAADIQEQATDLDSRVQGALARRGADPTSGAGIFGGTDVRTGTASALAGSGVNATNTAKDRFINQATGVVADGTNKEGGILNNMQGIADEQTRNNIMRARAKAAARSEMLKNIGQAASQTALGLSQPKMSSAGHMESYNQNNAPKALGQQTYQTDSITSYAQPDFF